jgi:hypothetical protein
MLHFGSTLFCNSVGGGARNTENPSVESDLRGELKPAKTNNSASLPQHKIISLTTVMRCIVHAIFICVSVRGRMTRGNP